MTYIQKIARATEMIKADTGLMERLLEVQKDTLLMALDDDMEDYFNEAMYDEFNDVETVVFDALIELGFDTLSDAC